MYYMHVHVHVMYMYLPLHQGHIYRLSKGEEGMQLCIGQNSNLYANNSITFVKAHTLLNMVRFYF